MTTPMTDRELMQQALDGLEAADEGQIWLSHLPKLITALRERLAQPEQEPAYRCRPYSSVPNAKVSPPVDYYTVPQPRQPVTKEMVVAAARMLSDRSAALCNVDCGDMWMKHGKDFIDDARAALEAAHNIKEKNT